MDMLLDRIAEKSARVGIIGQGYVGLPLALVFQEAGFQVTGFDVDAAKVAAITACQYALITRRQAREAGLSRKSIQHRLDAGLWAAVPVAGHDGRRQARMVRAFDEIPRDADRVIFFPRAAGGS